jgi:hypothetical protein
VVKLKRKQSGSAMIIYVGKSTWTSQRTLVTPPSHSTYDSIIMLGVMEPADAMTGGDSKQMLHIDIHARCGWAIDGGHL